MSKGTKVSSVMIEIVPFSPFMFVAHTGKRTGHEGPEGE